jgi:hypothetical protein
MGSRLLYSVCGLVFVLISCHASEAVGQMAGYPAQPLLGSWVDHGSLASKGSCHENCGSAASVHVGWMTAPNKIRVGYDGLVPPGACVSSYFVYPLSGLQVGGSLPIKLAGPHALRLYGSFLVPSHDQAGQEITWTIHPPGVREWRRSDSQRYKLGGEALYRMSSGMALLGGFRLESLLANFGDPNPAYLFTIPEMEAQTSVTFYEPYVGISLQMGSRPRDLTFRLAGFPFLFASIRHLNVCNNGGIPFAHTGSQQATKGFFIEAAAQYRMGIMQGMGVAGFVEWNVYRGQCPMAIDRHEGGPAPQVTSATVSWTHDISSLVVGGTIELAWNLPW